MGLGGREPRPSHRGKRPGSSGIVRARPRTPAPLLITHSLCYVFHPIPPLAFRLPHRAQRPLPPSVLFPPQNGVTPALKLGSPVLTARDSWGYPPIIRFYRPLVVVVKPDCDSGRNPPRFGTSRPLLSLGIIIPGMWPLSPRLIAHLVSHLAVFCGSILRLSRGMWILHPRLRERLTASLSLGYTPLGRACVTLPVRFVLVAPACHNSPRRSCQAIQVGGVASPPTRFSRPPPLSVPFSLQLLNPGFKPRVDSSDRAR